MANSRICIACKHCGEQLYIGKGYFGSYVAFDNLTEKLDEFFKKHEMGICSDDADCSDDAKNHFVILEEGDSLDDVPNIEQVIEEFKSIVINYVKDRDLLLVAFKDAVALAEAELKKKYIGE